MFNVFGGNCNWLIIILIIILISDTGCRNNDCCCRNNDCCC